jgi:ADP-heptose:LPS heptosyltransferase
MHAEKNSPAHTSWSQLSFKLPPRSIAVRLRVLIVNAICLAGTAIFSVSRALFRPAHCDSPPHKVLLIRRGGVGDFVMLTYLARSLKTAFPQASLHLLTGKQSVALAPACPYIDEILPVPKTWSEWLSLIPQLRDERYDVALIHHRFFAAPLLAWLCGIPTRVGYFWNRHGFALTDGIPFEPRESQLQEAFKLVQLLGETPQARESGLTLREEDIAACKRLLHASGYDSDRVLVGLHVGGAQAVGNSEVTRQAAVNGPTQLPAPVRYWPPEHFARVADRLIREQNVQIVVFHGPGDEAAIQATVEAMTEKPFIVTPLMPIRQFAALISLCDLVVASDSGPMHIAVALDTPVLGIFGPTHPGHTGPLGPKHRIAWAGLACSPCWSNEEIALSGKWNGGNAPSCWRKTHECMVGLLPDKVFAIAVEQLAEIISRSEASTFIGV